MQITFYFVNLTNSEEFIYQLVILIPITNHLIAIIIDNIYRIVFPFFFCVCQRNITNAYLVFFFFDLIPNVVVYIIVFFFDLIPDD